MLRRSCHLGSAFPLSCPSWFAGFLLCSATLFTTEQRCARGMRVTSTGPRTIQKAEGESVTLGCSYTPGPLDTGELVIEWSVVNPDAAQKDQRLISYTGGAEHVHGSHALAKGLSFAARDPSTGDASLSVPQLSPAHGVTYQCKVEKSPGVDAREVSVVVTETPSAPKCWVEGGELVGEAVSLHCESAKGSPPLQYAWRRESADPVPAAATQNSATGELKISNHSQSFAGTYLCEVNNAVGAERCRINLRANKPPNRAAAIVGTAVGSLLLVFILLVFLGLLYWKLSSRRDYEKEFSNEIREDAPPPESRPISRRTTRSNGECLRAAYSPATGTDADRFGGSARGPSGNCHAPLEREEVQRDGEYGHGPSKLGVQCLAQEHFDIYPGRGSNH